VPLSAAGDYGALQLLHFSGVQLGGTAGPITAVSADAVQVAAYLGDVTETGGPLSLPDATSVASVANSIANTILQTIPGFASFPTLDPAVIGDVSLQGSVTPTDAGAMTQEVGGAARITIPYAPVGLSVAPATLAVDAGTAHSNLTASASIPPVSVAEQSSDIGRRTPDTGPVSPQVALGLSGGNFSGSVRDLSALQSASSSAQPQRFADDVLANLEPTALSGLLTAAGNDVQYVAPALSEGAEPDALAAVFAREGMKFVL
jgi:hypothetical protein